MSFALSAALYTAFAPSETFPTSLAFAIALTAFPPPVTPGTIESHVGAGTRKHLKHQAVLTLFQTEIPS